MIRKDFGMSATLREGHDGILEIRLNGKVVYSNASQCGRLPEPVEVRRILVESGAKSLGKGQEVLSDEGIFRGLSCPLTLDSPAAGKEGVAFPMAGDGCACSCDKEGIEDE
jgi:hypothetical protein